MSKKRPNVSKFLYSLSGLIFPGHFSSMIALKAEIENEKIEKELKSFFEAYSENSIDNVEKCKQDYVRIQHAVDKAVMKQEEAEKLKINQSLSRGLIEHLPSTVLLLSLSIISFKQTALRTFVMDRFVAKVADYYKYLVLIICSTTLLSIVFTIAKIRYIDCIFTF